MAGDDRGFCQMERLEFEPFGERLTPHDGVERSRGVSKWLLWAGSAIFWSLTVAIVVARAAYFDPSVFSSFEHLAALTRSVTGF
jgi:hypothetical protein